MNSDLTDPLVHGLLPASLPYFERAAQGDAKALLEIAKGALLAEAKFGEIAALCAAEVPAMLAAVAGGDEERRFCADLYMRQSNLLSGDGRRLVLRQAESLYREIGDEAAANSALAAVDLP